MGDLCGGLRRKGKEVRRDMIMAREQALGQ